MTPPQRGDSERQAFLRDKATKEEKIINAGPDAYSIYIQKILSRTWSGNTVIDVGCGTAHVILELAREKDDVFCVGLDISSGMVRIERRKTAKVFKSFQGTYGAEKECQ
nr:methyltransferase domain-containing protein [Candidatus Njordarchaeum guaymaensis]